MRSEPSGSLNETRRSSPLRATSADNVGMPIVFSPPPVSALNTSVARYFSGSRALIPESDSVAGLALTFAGAEFVFAAMLVFEFVFVVVGVPQPIAIETSAMVATKQTAVDILK